MFSPFDSQSFPIPIDIVGLQPVTSMALTLPLAETGMTAGPLFNNTNRTITNPIPSSIELQWSEKERLYNTLNTLTSEYEDKKAETRAISMSLEKAEEDNMCLRSTINVLKERIENNLKEKRENQTVHEEKWRKLMVDTGKLQREAYILKSCRHLNTTENLIQYITSTVESAWPEGDDIELTDTDDDQELLTYFTHGNAEGSPTPTEEGNVDGMVVLGTGSVNCTSSATDNENELFLLDNSPLNENNNIENRAKEASNPFDTILSIVKASREKAIKRKNDETNAQGQQSDSHSLRHRGECNATEGDNDPHSNSVDYANLHPFTLRSENSAFQNFKADIDRSCCDMDIAENNDFVWSRAMQVVGELVSSKNSIFSHALEVSDTSENTAGMTGNANARAKKKLQLGISLIITVYLQQASLNNLSLSQEAAVMVVKEMLQMDNSSVGSDAESRARRLVQYAVDALDEEDIHITDNVPPGQQDQKNYITKPNPRPHTSSAAASSVQDDTPVTTDAESVLTLKKTVVLLSERMYQMKLALLQVSWFLQRDGFYSTLGAIRSESVSATPPENLTAVKTEESPLVKLPSIDVTSQQTSDICREAVEFVNSQLVACGLRKMQTTQAEAIAPPSKTAVLDSKVKMMTDLKDKLITIPAKDMICYLDVMDTISAVYDIANSGIADLQNTSYLSLEHRKGLMEDLRKEQEAVYSEELAMTGADDSDEDDLPKDLVKRFREKSRECRQLRRTACGLRQQLQQSKDNNEVQVTTLNGEIQEQKNKVVHLKKRCVNVKKDATSLENQLANEKKRTSNLHKVTKNLMEGTQTRVDEIMGIPERIVENVRVKQIELEHTIEDKLGIVVPQTSDSSASDPSRHGARRSQQERLDSLRKTIREMNRTVRRLKEEVDKHTDDNTAHAAPARNSGNVTGVNDVNIQRQEVNYFVDDPVQDDTPTNEALLAEDANQPILQNAKIILKDFLVSNMERARNCFNVALDKMPSLFRNKYFWINLSFLFVLISQVWVRLSVDYPPEEA